MAELSDSLKSDVGEFMDDLSKIVQTFYPNKKTFVVQPWNCYLNPRFDCGLDIYVGGQIKGSFKAFIYSNQENDQSVIDSDCYKNTLNFLENNAYKLAKLNREIVEAKPRTRSFNIFFTFKKKKIEICYNRIGNMSKKKCGIYKKFKIDQ